MGQKGTRKETAALIVALSIGCSQAEAGRRAGCDRRTVSRRLRDPAFVARLSRAKDKIIATAATRASASMLLAVATLSKLMKCEDESIQLRAADLMLSHAAKLRESNELVREIREIREIVNLHGGNTK